MTLPADPHTPPVQAGRRAQDSRVSHLQTGQGRSHPVHRTAPTPQGPSWRPPGTGQTPAALQLPFLLASPLPASPSGQPEEVSDRWAGGCRGRAAEGRGR